MSRHPVSSCAFLALSAVLSASDGRAPAADGRSGAGVDEGMPALFSWADIDGDGRLDLAAVRGDGTLQLLASTGEGGFEDVSERIGLSGVGNAALALWADYDADGRLDLFVGAREGASRLFRNEGGVFVDMSSGSGLTSQGTVRSAHWIDHDGDGLLDLFVDTAARSELFRGLEGGFFEALELPAHGGTTLGPIPGSSGAEPEGSGVTPDPEGSGPGSGTAGRRPPTLSGGNVPGAGFLPGAPPDIGSPAAVMPLPSCAIAIRDQASPTMCLAASTTPTLGRLYPLSANLFVATSGEVGIGTTSPSSALDVAGSLVVSDDATADDLFAERVHAGAIDGGSLPLELQTAGTTRAFIDELTGNLGLNTTTPAHLLHIVENTTTDAGFRITETRPTFGSWLQLENPSRTWSIISDSDPDQLRVETGAGELKLVVESAGNVGIGTGDPTDMLHIVESGSTGGLRVTENGAGLGSSVNLENPSRTWSIVSDSSPDQIRFETGPGQIRFVIDSSGNTGIGTSAPGFLLEVNGTAGKPGGGSWSVSSDERLKKNVRDLEGALETLLALRGVTFEYRDPEASHELPGTRIGFLAQEVEQVLPDWVEEGRDGYKRLTVRGFEPLAVEALRELTTEVAEKTREISELRQRVAELELLRAEMASLRASVGELAAAR